MKDWGLWRHPQLQLEAKTSSYISSLTLPESRECGLVKPDLQAAQKDLKCKAEFS
jgi:hypothetical protein